MCRVHFIALVAATSIATLVPVRAVPPTVTPSPGYDARLQESRKTMSTAVQPPLAAQPHRHHHRRPRH